VDPIGTATATHTRAVRASVRSGWTDKNKRMMGDMEHSIFPGRCYVRWFGSDFECYYRIGYENEYDLAFAEVCMHGLFHLKYSVTAKCPNVRKKCARSLFEEASSFGRHRRKHNGRLKIAPLRPLDSHPIGRKVTFASSRTTRSFALKYLHNHKMSKPPSDFNRIPSNVTKGSEDLNDPISCA